MHRHFSPPSSALSTLLMLLLSRSCSSAMVPPVLPRSARWRECKGGSVSGKSRRSELGGMRREPGREASHYE